MEGKTQVLASNHACNYYSYTDNLVILYTDHWT